MPQKILVIGGVALGPKAACRCKRLLPDAEVTLIDENVNISYGGCGIPLSTFPRRLLLNLSDQEKRIF